MRPECLEHLETGNDGCVVIGHTDRRRRHMASHALGDWDPGVRRYRGQLVLDARLLVIIHIKVQSFDTSIFLECLIFQFGLLFW